MSEEGPEARTEPDGEDLGFTMPRPAVLTRTRAIAIGVTAVAVIGAAFVLGYLPGRKARGDLAAATRAAEQSVPRVEVVRPKPVSSDRALTLSGTVQPLESTIVYPRANG